MTSPYANLNELFLMRQECNPETRAFTYLRDGEEEDTVWTYGQLGRKARAVAAALQSASALGQRALLLYPSGPDFVAAFWGCLLAGAIAVPVYLPRFNHNLQRLKLILRDAEAGFVLCSQTVLQRMQPFIKGDIQFSSLCFISTDTLSDNLAAGWKNPGISPSAIAFLQYTSGSTDDPKGVMVSHSNVLANQKQIQKAFQQTSESLIVGWLPLYHDMGLLGNVIHPVYLGAQWILLSHIAFLQRPYRWLKAISDYRATVSGGPNFAYDLCTRRITDEEMSSLDLSCWKVAFNGAEPVRAETLEKFSAKFGRIGFNASAFSPCYGLAEATLYVSGHASSSPPRTLNLDRTCLQEHRVRLSSNGAATRRIVSSGRLACGDTVAVVNPESLVEIAPDEIGEIWVSGPSIAQGYWRNQDSGGVFRARLAGRNVPYLRTGDTGFVDNGELFITGRLKDLIIVRGRNHYPQDIEATAETACPVLRAGSGAAFSIEAANGEEELVIVYEVERGGEKKTGGAIGAIYNAVVEQHEIQPAAIALVRHGTIPKTSSGKVQRYLCRNSFLAGTLEAITEWRPKVSAENVVPFLPVEMPLTVPEMENWLASKIAAARGQRPDSINLDNSLTSYALDSIAAVELSYAMEREFGIEIPVSELLSSRSGRQLAAQLLAAGQQKEDRISRKTSEIMTRNYMNLPIPDARDEQATTSEASVFPASFAQQRLWFIDQLTPGATVYNIPGAVRIRGPLNQNALEKSLQEVVNRHESLRTRFVTMNNEPAQVIEEHVEIRLSSQDLSYLPKEKREIEVQKAARSEAQKPFDLHRAPLLRGTLVKMDDQEHILVLTMHHIIADGWSLGVILRELSLLYDGFDSGQPISLPELPIQYADYSMWQRERFAGPVLEQQLEYWKKQLAGIVPLELPADHPRPAMQSHRGTAIDFKLPSALTRDLRELSQCQGVTLYMTLLAAYQVLLYRYSGQQDIAVGSPIAGRTRREAEALVGLFINTVVLRADLSAKPEFLQLLQRVKSIALEAYAHQEAPFEKLVETLAPERDLSRSPLFQVWFVLQTAPQSQLRLGPAKLDPFSVDTGTAKFDITLVMQESGNEIEGNWEYSTDLFEAATMQRMIGHFQVLLASIASAPKQSIALLPLMTPAEQQQILQWTLPEPHSVEHCVQQLFTQQALRTPKAIAATCEGLDLSYAELNSRANHLAHYLIKLGIKPETRVGICVDRSLEMLVGLVGILKAGGTYLPLDPNYPPERLGFLLEDSHAPVVLTQAKLKANLPPSLGKIVQLDADWPAISLESGSDPEVKTLPDNACHVIYTSGSTGRPKGVLTTHANVVRLMDETRRWFSFGERDVWTFFHSYAFDFSVWEIWGALLHGGRLVVIPHLVSRSPEEYLQLLAREQVTVLNQTPSGFKQLMRAQEARKEALPLSLRVVVLAGEALEFQTLRSWLDYYPQSRIVNMYGPTEATVHSTYHPVSTKEIQDRETRSRIGGAIPDLSVHVLDEEMQLIPIGVRGEIYIGGPGLARGYLDRPELTAERFLPDPFAVTPGGRLYRTGDQGSRRTDGALEYFGRLDLQVKIRGYRIELGEIESALREHLGVKESVVIAREDIPGDKRLVAYLVAGAEVTVGELREALSARLPEYMVPSAFVMLERMPLNPNGKIDRRALPAPAQRGVESNYVAPENPTEELMAQIWAEVLRLERVGMEDNFFELGGHSLLATQIVLRVRETFHLDLPLVKLFESPTVRSAARAIEELRNGGSETAKEQGIRKLERKRKTVPAQ